MKQLTKNKELIGKTISDVIVTSRDKVCIKFTDSTFALMVTEYDQDLNAYAICNQKLDGYPTLHNIGFQRDIGAISTEEYNILADRLHEEWVDDIKRSEMQKLKELKEKYPNE